MISIITWISSQFLLTDELFSGPLSRYTEDIICIRVHFFVIDTSLPWFEYFCNTQDHFTSSLKYLSQSELHYTDIITLKLNTSQSSEGDGSKLESLGQFHFQSSNHWPLSYYILISSSVFHNCLHHCLLKVVERHLTSTRQQITFF